MGNIESHSEEGIPSKQDNQIISSTDITTTTIIDNNNTTTENNNQQTDLIHEPFQVKMIGEAESFRVFAQQEETSEQLSMWHDLKLFPEKDSKKKKIVNMICEIPKCSRKKYEIATKEPGLSIYF